MCYDPFVIGLLPLAMSLGENLEIAGEIDLELHNNLCDAIALYHSWFPSEVKVINLKAEGFRTVRMKGERTGSFFSGGVDSLFNYSYFDSQYPRKQVTDLVLVKGMDIRLSEDALWAKVSEKMTELAATLDKSLVIVETNLRDFQDGKVNWTHTGFGPILGSVANVLAPDLSLMLIGSYGLFSELTPHASGPLIDRLWSSSGQSVVHFTPRVSRLDKLRIIMEKSPQSLSYVRVCWQNPDSKYNCGVCEKCLRTRMELRLIGAEGMAASFPETALSGDIANLPGKIPIDDVYTYYFWKEICGYETDPLVKKSLVSAINTYKVNRALSFINQRIRSIKKRIKRTGFLQKIKRRFRHSL